MKRLAGSILGGLCISILLSAVFPGICLISFLSTSGAGGFTQKDCLDSFWPFFKIVFPGMLALQSIGSIFKIKWIERIDIFRVFGN